VAIGRIGEREACNGHEPTQGAQLFKSTIDEQRT
jgi:hypothetical protein